MLYQQVVNGMLGEVDRAQGMQRNVDLVVADGRFMRSEGKFATIDEDKIKAELVESNARLAAFANP